MNIRVNRCERAKLDHMPGMFARLWGSSIANKVVSLYKNKMAQNENTEWQHLIAHKSNSKKSHRVLLHLLCQCNIQLYRKIVIVSLIAGHSPEIKHNGSKNHDSDPFN